MPVEKLRSEYTKDSWVWDEHSKPEDVLLSSNRLAAYFHIDPVLESTGTAGVRGTKGFSEGEHYWEIKFLEPPCGTSVMVGVGTKQALLHTDNYNFIDLLGRDEHSWGLSYKGCTWHRGSSTPYCEPFYDQSTIISVHLNLYMGTLTFYKDGQCLGVAFKGLNQINEPLYPIVCSTATNSEMEVETQTCRFSSLQEKCCHLVSQCVNSQQNIDLLPLPNVIKSHIADLRP